MPVSLPWRHLLLAVAVVAIWGSNFVVIKLALAQLPPLLLATLRYTFALLPAVFFLRRPAVPWRNLATYGVLIGAGQFGLLFIAMNGHISPGLASLVIQTQVFFTIGLAMRSAGEKLQPVQWVALAVAAVGLGIIATHTDGSTTVLGLALVLMAAFSWAAGNMTSRAAGRVDMLAYVVWASAFAIPPMRWRGARCCGRPWATRSSATPPGAGCSRATRPPPSRPWRCWCRCSASPALRGGWASRCPPGSCSPPRWCSAHWR
jgi:O-acetylserine/cysteine efflux transporter